MQEVADTLKEKNVTIVALTPKLPEHNAGMREKNKLSFDLLSDPGNEYAAKLGLKFDLPDDLIGVYKGFGIDLPVHSGSGGWALPMPGRFVIDSSGIIRAVDVDPDYTQRPEVEKTLDDVAKL